MKSFLVLAVFTLSALAAVNGEAPAAAAGKNRSVYPLSIYLSIYLFIYLSIYRSIYLSIKKMLVNIHSGMTTNLRPLYMFSLV